MSNLPSPAVLRARSASKLAHNLLISEPPSPTVKLAIERWREVSYVNEWALLNPSAWFEGWKSSCPIHASLYRKELAAFLRGIGRHELAATL